MFFGLGLLVATLIALMVLPAVWHRAVRLTTRRIEAAVPVSLFEIQADKDQQRAAFALNQCRLELRATELQETIAGNARTLEQHRLKIVALEQDLAKRAEAHAGLVADHADLNERYAAEVSALEERTTHLAETTLRLATRDGELAESRSLLERTRLDLEQEIGRTRDLTTQLAARDAALVTRAGEVSALTAKGQQLASDLARTEAALADVTGTLEAERLAARNAQELADAARGTLETDLAATRENLALQSEAARSRAERVAALERERDRLARDLAQATAELEAARILAHALEQSRTAEFERAQTDLRRLGQEMDILRADHSMMVTALENARASARSSLGGSPLAGASQGDLDVLRNTLADVAARIVAQALPEEAVSNPSHKKASDASDGTAPATPGTISLADRIQQVRAEGQMTSDGDVETPANSLSAPANAPSPTRRSAGRRTS